LWLVQSVDTAQAHIYHIYIVPNLYKIKFLENLFAGLRGSGISGVEAGNSGFSGYSGPGPETLGCKGIKTFDHGKNFFFHLYSVSPRPLLSPIAPFLSLCDLLFQPAKLSESEGVKAPRREDQGSTQVSRDPSPLPSLPKVHSKEFFPIYFPNVVLVVSS
jgi:hypothetical protein